MALEIRFVAEFASKNALPQTWQIRKDWSSGGWLDRYCSTQKEAEQVLVDMKKSNSYRKEDDYIYRVVKVTTLTLTEVCEPLPVVVKEETQIITSASV